MAVTVTEIPGAGPVVPHSDGDDWELRCQLTFSGSYPAGNGETTFKESIEAILKQLGFGAIDWVLVNGVPGYIVVYNYSTGKLQIFEGAAGVLKELAAGAYPGAITGATVRCVVAGR